MIDLEDVARVARRLESVGIQDPVFVGGSVIRLYLTDPLAPSPRHTDDVDVIVATATRVEYNKLEQRLRDAGHTQVAEGPTCRWSINDVTVDLMPGDASVLGFVNRWYAAILASDDYADLPSGKRIRIPSAPYLLATKVEAFRGRGEGDYQASRDIEDIVILLDGREELYIEVLAADPPIKKYLVEAARELLGNFDFIASLAGHLLPDPASQARAEIVLARMRHIALIEP